MNGRSGTAQEYVPSTGKKINFNNRCFLKDPLNEKIAEKMISNFECSLRQKSQDSDGNEHLFGPIQISFQQNSLDQNVIETSSMSRTRAVTTIAPDSKRPSRTTSSVAGEDNFQSEYAKIVK